MMRPSTSTLVIGYPPVTGALLLLDGFFGYLAVFGSAPGWVGVVALICAGGLAKTSSEAARYRAWRRDWEAMDPDAGMKPKGTFLRSIGIILVAAFCLLAFAQLGPAFADPSSPALVIVLLMTAALAFFWVAARWLRTRRQTRLTKEWIVSQCARRPLPAPSAKDAYAALPDYCRPLLNP
jgi:threonine/homoserine/homoserine lactone efflux protein